MYHNLILSSLLGAVIMAVVGCSQPRTESVEHTDEYGYLENYERRVDTYAKEGLYTRTSSKGVRVEEAFYRNDTLHGQRILFYASGDTSTVETYQAGSFEGPFRTFHENGQVKQSGQYIGNVMQGPWTAYYDNGQIREIVQFVDGDENGPFSEYYPNGQLKAEGQYLEGDYEHGELKMYDEAGELIRKMDCNRGRCQTTWKADGQP